MDVIILAGGKGTRLKPYTTVVPKPLMPIGEQSILEIILKQLHQSGAKRVVLAVGYLGHLFQAVFGNGEKFGLEITYLLEEKPLGTAGALANALDLVGENFIVMNGDVLTDLDYKALYQYHLSKHSKATIAINLREVAIDFGVINFDKNNYLTHYDEKPKHSFHVSMGVNVLNKEAVKPYLKSGLRLDMPDLITQVKDSGNSVLCYARPCFWLDIGRHEDFLTAQNLVEQKDDDFFLNQPILKAA